MNFLNISSPSIKSSFNLEANRQIRGVSNLRGEGNPNLQIFPSTNMIVSARVHTPAVSTPKSIERTKQDSKIDVETSSPETFTSNDILGCKPSSSYGRNFNG